jgi:hypothetical protein
MTTPKIDKIFNMCVLLLLKIADMTGLTYRQINVLIFCIIWPILTILLGIAALRK